MLRTRLMVGSVLAALGGGMLLRDERSAPWSPFLFATVTFLAAAGALELWRLLPPPRRPYLWVVLPGVLLVITANWLPLMVRDLLHQRWLLGRDPLQCATHVFTAVVLFAFLAEM